MRMGGLLMFCPRTYQQQTRDTTRIIDIRHMVLRHDRRYCIRAFVSLLRPELQDIYLQRTHDYLIVSEEIISFAEIQYF